MIIRLTPLCGFIIADPDDLETEHFTGDGGSLLIHGTAANTVLEIRDSFFRRSQAYGNGGAISLSLDSSPAARTYFVPGLGWAIPPVSPEPATLGGGCVGTISNTVFDSCNGGWQGGGISANGRGMDLGIFASTFTACKGGSTHLRDGKGGAVAVGGGYQNDGAPKNDVHLLDSCTVRNCNASGNGGGLYVTIRGLLRVDDTHIQGCKALDEGTDLSVGIDHRMIEGMGGGIHVSAGGFLRVQPTAGGTTTIEGNTAATSGGGISAKSGRIYLYNQVLIRGNKALGTAFAGYGNGGGLFCTTSLFDDGFLTWPDGSWLPKPGAGYWASKVFDENGFIQSTSSQVAIDSDNRAGRWGGGCYIGISPPWYDWTPDSGYNFLEPLVTLQNATVKNNRAATAAQQSSKKPSQIAVERTGSVAVPASPATLDFQNVTVSGDASTDIGVYGWHSMIFNTTGASFSSLAEDTLQEWP